MQRGRGGRDDFFDFGDPANLLGFGGFGGHSSLMSSFFGGRDPFDDPFFTRPLGSMFGSSMFGSSVFGPSMFSPNAGSFGDSTSGYLEHQSQTPNKSKGPVIEELTSDDESGGKEEEEKVDNGIKENNGKPRKHSRLTKPYVEYPDDEAEERKRKHLVHRNDYNRAIRTQPQVQNFSFQSSTVSYGGTNGAYYTSSTTRRAGSDGVMVEEKKEADSTTGQAKHRISRGIYDKGHSFTRKLNSDGKVETMQTLHNLNQDELPVFEEAWKGKARKHLPARNEGFNMHGSMGSSSSGRNEQATRGWALPSTESLPNPEKMKSLTFSRGKP